MQDSWYCAGLQDMDPVLQQPITFMQQRSIPIDSNALPDYDLATSWLIFLGCSCLSRDCRLTFLLLHWLSARKASEMRMCWLQSVRKPSHRIKIQLITEWLFRSTAARREHSWEDWGAARQCLWTGVWLYNKSRAAKDALHRSHSVWMD